MEKVRWQSVVQALILLYSGIGNLELLYEDEVYKIESADVTRNISMLNTGTGEWTVDLPRMHHTRKGHQCIETVINGNRGTVPLLINRRTILESVLVLNFAKFSLIQIAIPINFY